MAKTISGDKYERNKADFDLELHRLQVEHLKLSTKQIRRYWWYTAISFTLGVLSTEVTKYIGGADKADRMQLERRITSLEQIANPSVNSTQILKVLDTILMDSSLK